MWLARKIIPAVKTVLLVEGKVLLVRRSSFNTISPGMWELPGGKMKFGETLEEALYREVKEETGIAAQIERLLYASTFVSGSRRQALILCYLSRAETRDVRLSFEHKEYLWATYEELLCRLDTDILRDMEREQVFEALFP